MWHLENESLVAITWRVAGLTPRHKDELMSFWRMASMSGSPKGVSSVVTALLLLLVPLMASFNC